MRRVRLQIKIDGGGVGQIMKDLENTRKEGSLHNSSEHKNNRRYVCICAGLKNSKFRAASRQKRLFLYDYLVIIFIFHMNNSKPTFAHPVYTYIINNIYVHELY